MSYNFSMDKLSGERRAPGWGKSGQAMIEYALTAVVLVVLLSVMAVLLHASKSQARRAAELVSSEYP